MSWSVLFHSAFESEFDSLPERVQDELLAHAHLLQEFGPTLGRPRVDTLKASRHTNMKELRFDADNGVWRVAFAFDPARQGSYRSRATNRAEASGAFTGSLSARPTSGWTSISPG